MSRRLEQTVLIAAMSAGCLLMWTAVPAAWIWIAGRYSRVSQSEMSSIAILFVGFPATMVAIGLVLGRLDDRYSRRFGAAPGGHVAGARWLHSLRGGHDDEPATALDKILIINVALALLALLVWFALFSQGSQAPRA